MMSDMTLSQPKTDENWGSSRSDVGWKQQTIANMRNLVASTWRSSQVRAKVHMQDSFSSDQTIILQSQNPQPARLMWQNQHARSHWSWLPLPKFAKLMRFYRKAAFNTQFQGNIFFTIDDWNRASRAQRFSVIFPAPDTFKPPWVGAGRDRVHFCLAIHCAITKQTEI